MIPSDDTLNLMVDILDPIGRLTSPCNAGEQRWRRGPSPDLERDEDRLAEKTGSQGEVYGTAQAG
ncbi:MAG: hypothetical protein JXB30_13525 [Anaerolineae bacterium]|nr:hypothetical protein [Anaerolineae bacterium]